MTASEEIVEMWKHQIAKYGWICRRCSNGDHKACELEQRGIQCACNQGKCGVA